jgi:hypothetical protein
LGEIDISFKLLRSYIGFCTPARHNVLVKDLDFPLGLVSNLVDEIEHALFAEGDSLAGPRPAANCEGERGYTLPLMFDRQAIPRKSLGIRGSHLGLLVREEVGNVAVRRVGERDTRVRQRKRGKSLLPSNSLHSLPGNILVVLGFREHMYQRDCCRYIPDSK